MRKLATALLAGAALALAACGTPEPEPAPLACQQGPGAFVEAVAAAPEPALLDGETPVSACLVREQSAGELNGIGAAMIAAVTELNGRARSERDGDAALQLGYLVGSIEEGASKTGGVHTDLVRRVNSSARFSEGDEELGARFERAFGAGYAAARAAG